MAFEHGKAGKSTRDLENKRYGKRVIMGLVGLAMMALFYLFISSFILPKSKGISGIISLLIAGIGMRIMADMISKEDKELRKLERRASRGAGAEERIGDLLGQLPDDYAVFHDIESPYGNIDHIVINKKNVIFLLETKSHSGTVTYNGTYLLINNNPAEKDFISQTLKNTYWLKNNLEEQIGMALYVKPIIVFTNAFVKVPKAIKGVSVINKKYLIKSLIKTPENVKITTSNDPKISLYTALQRLQKNGKDYGGQKRL